MVGQACWQGTRSELLWPAVTLPALLLVWSGLSLSAQWPGTEARALVCTVWAFLSIVGALRSELDGVSVPFSAAFVTALVGIRYFALEVGGEVPVQDRVFLAGGSAVAAVALWAAVRSLSTLLVAAKVHAGTE